MKYLYFLYLLLLSVGCSVNSNKESQNFLAKEETNNEIIILDINNENPNKMGLKIYKDDESIGIKSILLVDNFVFLVDAFHNNIKRINLKTKEVQASQVLSHDGKNIWLRDISIVNEKIYLLSDLEMNYILSTDFKLIDSFKLERGVKYFYETSDNKITIYKPDKYLEIDANGKLLKEHKGKYIDILKLAHGKEYIIENDSIIKNEYGQVNLSEPFPYLWEQYYDGISIDFNDKKVVYLQIEDDKYYLKLFYYN